MFLIHFTCVLQLTYKSAFLLGGYILLFHSWLLYLTLTLSILMKFIGLSLTRSCIKILCLSQFIHAQLVVLITFILK